MTYSPTFGKHTPHVQFLQCRNHQVIIDCWTQEYYRVLDEWIAQGRFAGKDQDIMIDIVERHPDRFLLLESHGEKKIGRTKHSVESL